jgi:hypothetical protein
MSTWPSGYASPGAVLQTAEDWRFVATVELALRVLHIDVTVQLVHGAEASDASSGLPTLAAACRIHQNRTG